MEFFDGVSIMQIISKELFFVVKSISISATMTITVHKFHPRVEQFLKNNSFVLSTLNYCK